MIKVKLRTMSVSTINENVVFFSEWISIDDSGMIAHINKNTYNYIELIKKISKLEFSNFYQINSNIYNKLMMFLKGSRCINIGSINLLTNNLIHPITINATRTNVNKNVIMELKYNNVFNNIPIDYLLKVEFSKLKKEIYLAVSEDEINE